MAHVEAVANLAAQSVGKELRFCNSRVDFLYHIARGVEKAFYDEVGRVQNTMADNSNEDRWHGREAQKDGMASRARKTAQRTRRSLMMCSQGAVWGNYAENVRCTANSHEHII